MGVPEATYDGYGAAELRDLLGVPRVALYDEVGSTLDVAHELAAGGAEAGTLVLADRQTAGRGRGGKSWSSPSGAGVWMTLLERPSDPRVLDVLSLRVGMRAAEALDPFSDEWLGVKWPNDLYIGQRRKLGGILIEARWHGDRPAWVAVGIGVNVVPPAGVEHAAGLRAGTARVEVLAALVPAVRRAAAMRGHLDKFEVWEFGNWDVASGERCISPARGVARGVNRAGELQVWTDDGCVTSHRHGSLILDEWTEGGA